MCPGGFSCATPSDLPTACSDGSYSAQGATVCTVCPAGSYCPGPTRDEESKALCPPGTYSESGASSCSRCPKGYYCPDAAQPPVACPSGYYAHTGNMTACDMQVSLFQSVVVSELFFPSCACFNLFCG